MACRHQRLTFEHRFAVRDGNGVYDLVGHCAECGAAVLFEPKPTLSFDDRNFQIPFRFGAPDPLRLLPQPISQPIVIGGARKVPA